MIDVLSDESNYYKWKKEHTESMIYLSLCEAFGMFYN